MQTPIEIALGVDENGMTTAKKLYEFLEMDKSHYSRWAKANIVDNEFATENEDYFYSPSMANESSRGNFADDYKLTAHFAKKLSMKGNGEKAEEAREYFTHLGTERDVTSFPDCEVSSSSMSAVSIFASR